MWFKNLIIYQFTKPPVLDETLEPDLTEHRFHPCRSLDMDSYGWVSPMGKLSESLAHIGSGFTLLCAKKENKILPASVIRDFVNEKIALIQDNENRKVNQKEKSEIKEEVLLDLIPKAFSKFHLTYGLLMPKQGFLVVDTTTAKKAEEFTGLLRKTLGGLSIIPLEVSNDPAMLFSAWISEKEIPPNDIVLGEECELKSTGEDGAVVRCRKQVLKTEEIQGHLQAGKQAVKLAMAWDNTLSFVLTEDLVVKKLKFSDTLIEQAADDAANNAETAFDADFTLMSLELARFLHRLTEIFNNTRE